VLPDLDGVTPAILGLHTCAGSTVLYLHFSGPRCDASYHPGELYYWPCCGSATAAGAGTPRGPAARTKRNGEVALRLEAVPPLSRGAAWIELLAAGQPAQARAVRPLCWQ
jgi:hypothetical protein